MYTQQLEKMGVTPTITYPWAKVGNTTRIQGWKIHLSSINREGIDLMKSVVPILLEEKVCFKVAYDNNVLSLLNEGSFGVTQVGKFMTIYPHDDSNANIIVEELINVTEKFHGPIIATDLRLGNVVYARYGGFNPIVEIDRLGNNCYYIYGNNGRVVPDNYSIPIKLPEKIDIPFQVLNKRNPIPEEVQSTSKVIGPGYLLIDVISAHPKGSVYSAIDLRRQDSVSLKVIKEGRQFCLSDEHGRDMRDRLKHQENLHRILCNSIPIPKVEPYFEWNGHGYLPLEHINGESFNSVITGAWDILNLQQRIDLLRFLLKIINTVNDLHNLGFVHRDITPNNFIISKDKKLYILDLELTHYVDDKNAPYGAGTPGFMSPQQRAGRQPTLYDDIFALGSLMIMSFTCIDPNRILFSGENLRDNLRRLTKKVPQEIVDLISNCVNDDPIKRPSVNDIHCSLSNYLQQLESSKFTGSCTSLLPMTFDNALWKESRPHLQDIIMGGIKGLFDHTLKDEKTGLWLSAEIGHSARFEIEVPQYSIYRSANRGIAGPLYLLGRLARFGFSDDISKDYVQTAINWILADKKSLESGLPGLHFGNAGISMGIVECIAGGLIQRTEEIDKFLTSSLSVEPDWPDLTHGAAGQGLATIYCSVRLDDSKVLSFCHRYAGYLMRHQKDDGSWEMPPGVEGMSGERITGFAHGIAGIIYFLDEYDRLFDNTLANETCRLGLQWLMKHTKSSNDNRVLEWNWSEGRETTWKWWCHGSPGISLMFLRLFEHTKNQEYAKLAKKCLRVHPLVVRYSNLSQCHGLAGLGQIYLEASRVLGENEYRHKAEDIYSTLLHLGKNKSGAIAWLVEDPHFPTADLMVGSSGIVHFYLTYLLEREIGFPLLLDPIKGSK